MRIRSIAKKKVSDFLLGEAGQVARRSTFTVAALASASGLAAFLVATPPAEAGICGKDQNAVVCCGWDVYCCNFGVWGDVCVVGDDVGDNCRYEGPC